jgi:hypothetical protein
MKTGSGTVGDNNSVKQARTHLTISSVCQVGIALFCTSIFPNNHRRCRNEAKRSAIWVEIWGGIMLFGRRNSKSSFWNVACVRHKLVILVAWGDYRNAHSSVNEATYHTVRMCPLFHTQNKMCVFFESLLSSRSMISLTSNGIVLYPFGLPKGLQHQLYGTRYLFGLSKG